MRISHPCAAQVLVLVFLGTLAAYMEAMDDALGFFLVMINVVCFVMIAVLCYSDINSEKAAIKFLYNELETQAAKGRKSLQSMVSLKSVDGDDKNAIARAEEPQASEEI